MKVDIILEEHLPVTTETTDSTGRATLKSQQEDNTK